MTVVGDVYGGGEWLESLWVWELWDEGIRVDVEFFLLHSWAQIQVETSLESLLDYPVIEWNVSHLAECSWDEIEGFIFFMELLPFLFFLLT